MMERAKKLLLLYYEQSKKNRTIQGSPPLTFKGKGKDPKNYRIYGNTVNGENVGDRTRNLFDGEFLQGCWAAADGSYLANYPTWICTDKLPCKPNTAYTLSFNSANSRWYGFFWFAENGDYISSDTAQSPQTQCHYTATSPSNAAYMTIDIAGYPDIQSRITPSDVTDFMLVEGSTALPYEPYGYKVPVTTERSVPHTATLQLHDCLPSTMQFDAPEALYYAENGLTAGTYNFTIQDDYDTSYGGGKTYQFTLANDVPAKGQLVFGWTYNTQASAAKITSYASSTSTTAIEQVGVTEGSGGTSLGTTDGNSTNVNHIHRARYGSNNYKESAIRQFLNSSAVAGSVWTPQTKYDRPPSWNASMAGFMKDIDSDFLAVLGASPKVVALNTVTDGGGSVTINNDKFFLLSRSEVYDGKENNINEGEPYPYYSNYSDLSAAGVDDDSNRIKYRSGTAQVWWLRSPYSAYGYSVRSVYASGDVSYGNLANYSFGVAPACNIALDEDYKFNGQVLHVRDQISVQKGNQTLVFDVIGIDHDEVHFDKTTTNLYLPEQIKMVGNEAEYVDYKEQKQHRVRVNLFDGFSIHKKVPSVSNGDLVYSQSEGATTDFIAIDNGDITLSKTSAANSNMYIFLYAQDKSYIGCTQTSASSILVLTGNNVNGYQNAKYARIRVDVERAYAQVDVMLNIGSTPLPYEPYIENIELDITLPALPVLPGTNTLTVGTEVQPSSVEIKGRIKAAGGD